MTQIFLWEVLHSQIYCMSEFSFENDIMYCYQMKSIAGQLLIWVEKDESPKDLDLISKQLTVTRTTGNRKPDYNKTIATKYTM